MIKKLAALGAACALLCASSAANADGLTYGGPLPSGTGTVETLPTPPIGGYGVSLASGVIGTRVYLPTSSDSITYTVEPTAVCGVGAPDRTITATGPTAVDENTSYLVPTGVRNAICVTASAGSPAYRAY